MFQRIARRTLLCALLLSALSVNSNPLAAANEEIPRFAGQNRVAKGKSYKSPDNEVLREHRGRRIRNRFSPASLAEVNRQLSSRLNSSINDTFAPCDDFHNFACGSLKAPLLEETGLANVWYNLPPYNNTLRDYLMSADIDTDDKYEKAIHRKARQYYNACRNPLASESAKEHVENYSGLNYLYALHDKAGFRKFLSSAMAHLTLLQDGTFFSISDSTYDIEGGLNYLIFPGDLGSYAEDESLEETVYSLMNNFATTFKDVWDPSPDGQHGWVSSMTEKIVKFLKSFRAVADTTDSYEFESIDELQSNITWFNWKAYFSKLSKLSGNTRMVESRVFKVTNPKYFKKLGEFFADRHTRAAFEHVVHWRTIVNNKRHLWGQSEKHPQEIDQGCLQSVIDVFDFVYLHLVDQKFSNDKIKDEYQLVFRHIKDAVEENLKAVGFQEPSFLNRFRDMKLDMELPEIVKSSKMLNDHYRMLNFSSNDFYYIEQSAYKYKLSMLLGGISPDERVHKAIIYHLRGASNYSPGDETIYSSPVPEFRSHHQLGVPSLTRFATRGFMLAFGMLGLLGNPEFYLESRRVDDKDRAAFVKLDNYRSCIEDQFKGTAFDQAFHGAKMPLNLAISIAHKLWQKFDDKERLSIPYTGAQQFYLSFARGYCTAVHENEDLSDFVKETLQNSKGFHKAFQCPRRNEDVCRLW